jgi:hypothetical protein
MLYLSIALIIIAGLAWDFGRRLLTRQSQQCDVLELRLVDDCGLAPRAAVQPQGYNIRG